MTKYQSQLKGIIPQVNQMYDGYIKNFDKRTGQIIDINMVMKDKAAFQSVKEQSEAVEKLASSQKGKNSDII